MKQIVMLVMVVALAGCATTTLHLEEQSIRAGDAIFVVNQGTDPLEVGSIIAERIKTAGYPVQRADLDFFKPPIAKDGGPKSGSGFLINTDGVVLTNSHVVSGATKILVHYMGKEYEATVLGDDKTNDVALIKIVSDEPTEYIPLAPKMTSNVGATVFVIGFPLAEILGNEARVSNGIVSAKSGILSNPTRFQISASVQPGNSGGPVLDSDFRAIGLATEKLSDEKVFEETGSIPQNVNFGVKIEYARMLLDQTAVAVPSEPRNVDLAQAMAATVQIDCNPGNEGKSGSGKPQYIAVDFSYRYSWDVVHYILNSLTILWIDIEKRQPIGKATYQGETLEGSKETAARIVQSLLSSIKP